MEKTKFGIFVLAIGLIYPLSAPASALFRSSKKALEQEPAPVSAPAPAALPYVSTRSSGNPLPSSGSMAESPELQHDSGVFSDSDNSMMQAIAESAGRGVGRSNKGPVCYRSVKQIIADGLGRNLACVRGVFSGGSAINAMKDLPRAGFVNDMSKCRTKGVIRVYKGHYPGHGKRLLGDTAGHIEVLGSDGNYHSFYESPISIDTDMGKRRELVGCFVPDPAKVRAGPVGRCKTASHTGGSKTNSDNKGGNQ